MPPPGKLMKDRFDEWMKVKAPALQRAAGLSDLQVAALAATEVAASVGSTAEEVEKVVEVDTSLLEAPEPPAKRPLIEVRVLLALLPTHLLHAAKKRFRIL